MESVQKPVDTVESSPQLGHPQKAFSRRVDKQFCGDSTIEQSYIIRGADDGCRGSCQVRMEASLSNLRVLASGKPTATTSSDPRFIWTFMTDISHQKFIVDSGAASTITIQKLPDRQTSPWCLEMDPSFQSSFRTRVCR